MLSLSEEDLLNLAKGVQIPEEVQDQTAFNEAIQFWNISSKSNKERLQHRRKMRQELFKILKYIARNTIPNLSIKQQALKSIFDSQLDKNLGLDWNGFTFVWDVHPNGSPVVIRKESWVKSGGSFDIELGSHYPSAFTQQVIE